MSPDDLLYTKEHEWIRVTDNVGTVGITEFATKELGEVVYVELPKPGTVLERSKPIGVVESVKAVSDIYAPLSGTVTEVNSAVEDDPAKVNSDPFGDGWLVKLTLTDALDTNGLLDATTYDDLVKTL